MVFASCETLKEPDLQSNSVEFFIEGQLQGKVLVVEAGNDSAYMHTSFAKDSVEVFEFQGTLGHQDCDGSLPCEESITLCIRDGAVSNSFGATIDSSLQTGLMLYRGPLDSSISAYTVAFSDESYKQNTNVSYAWDFGDGNTSNSQNPTHTYGVNTPSPVQSCLTITDNGSGSSSTICNWIFLPANCRADYNYTFNGSTLNSLNATEQGTAPYTYLWDFGNGFLPLSGQTLPDFSTIDSLTVCVKIIDANNCEAIMCKNMIVSDSSLACAANFNWNVKPVWTPNLLDLNKVAIRYVDANGFTWSSDRYPQDDGVFRVVAVTNFDVNTDGNPTKSVTFQGRCKLYGTSQSDFISFTNMNGKMAIAYPN